ncbi:MAG: hypothetical protein IJ044_02755 [Oscillospiraceae bacterium]|nr:hypothetical protein [Oscillospiraceae bacterium]
MKLKQAEKLVMILCVGSAACLIAAVITSKLVFNILGILFVVAAGWAHTQFVRCPHCGEHLGKSKSANCPHCGKQISD